MKRISTQTWGAAVHEAMLEERVFSWISQRPVWADLNMAGWAKEKMRGWDSTMLPRDPDGLDDVDPFVLGLLTSRSSKPLMVLATSAYHAGPDSWMKRLFEVDSIVGRETDFTMIVGGGGVDADGRTYEIEPYEVVLEHSPIEVLRALQARMLEPPTEIEIDPRVYEQITGRGVITREELRRLEPIFITTPPEPGVRYGPYDADPHTPGRRKRFRKQRRS